MPYTMEDFEREAAEKLLKKLTPEQLLKKLTIEQRLAGLTTEQLLSLLPVQEIERYLQHRKGARQQDVELPPNDRGTP